MLHTFNHYAGNPNPKCCNLFYSFPSFLMTPATYKFICLVDVYFCWNCILKMLQNSVKQVTTKPIHFFYLKSIKLECYILAIYLLETHRKQLQPFLRFFAKQTSEIRIQNRVSVTIATYLQVLWQNHNSKKQQILFFVATSVFSISKKSISV